MTAEQMRAVVATAVERYMDTNNVAPDQRDEQRRGLMAMDPPDLYFTIGLVVGPPNRGGPPAGGEGRENGVNNVEPPPGARGGDDRVVEAINQPPAPPTPSEMEEAAKKAGRMMGGAPRYSGARTANSLNWRTFKLSFSNWATLSTLGRCEGEYQKATLFNFLEGSAFE